MNDLVDILLSMTDLIGLLIITGLAGFTTNVLSTILIIAGIIYILTILIITVLAGIFIITCLTYIIAGVVRSFVIFMVMVLIDAFSKRSFLSLQNGGNSVIVFLAPQLMSQNPIAILKISEISKKMRG